ncbi:MAG: hypothetical protein ABSB24_17700 [Gaiellaceae bacterium]|jgi:hypothetical protein
MIGRRVRLGLVAIAIVLTLGGLLAAAQARSSARTATWTWQASLPGDRADTAADAVAAAAGADPASVRELAAADGFNLLAASEQGVLVIGPASAGRAQLEPLTQATGDQPLVVYAAATPTGGQQELVGVARADVDRVEALLADGSEQPLPLNQWRGFDYVAPTPNEDAVGLLASSGSESLGAVRLPQTSTLSEGASAAAQPVYGLFRTSLRDQALSLARVDPRTLKPKTGPKLDLRAQWVNFMALSPDATQLALVTAPVPANGRPSSRERLQRVDLASMKVLSTRWINGDTIRTLSWPRPDRLIEIRQVMSQPYQRNVVSRTARVVDPATGRVIASHALTNKLAIRSAVSTPLGLVLLLGSSGLHGETVQLDLIPPDGGVGTVTIPVGAVKNVTRANGLAVDASSGHAYVVVAGGSVFDVDLHTMTITRHLVSAPAGASTLLAPVSFLQAQVFAGKLAVAGLFHRPGSSTLATQGVYLIDPTTWQASVLDPAANTFTALGDRLLTYGLTAAPRHAIPANLEQGHGLSLYDTTGKQISHLYGNRRFQNVDLVPGYGHVIYNGPHSSTVAIKPRSGRIVYLGPNDQLIFDLESGRPLGGAKLSSTTPPLGPPLLIYRGAADIGES